MSTFTMGSGIFAGREFGVKKVWGDYSIKSMELLFQDVYGAFIFVAGDNRLFLFQRSVCEWDFISQDGFGATGFDLIGTEVTHV